MKRAALAVLVGLTAAVVHALVIEQDDIRLRLHERHARFSMELRVGEEWIPLLFPDDPRTTALDVLEGNRVHRMGDSGSFSQSVEHTADRVGFVWTSRTLRVEQLFEFARGRSSARSNAVRMHVTVTNLGERESIVGVRLLLDTYLGESRNVHFSVPGMPRIAGETRIPPGPGHPYVASVPALDAAYGMQVALYGDGITTPTAVALANWRRLADARWDYGTNPNRNFNLLPYSVNDSAVLVVYEPRTLASGESRSVVTYLGDLSRDGFVSRFTAASDDRARLSRRLADLLEEVNRLLDAGDADAAQVADLQAELEELKLLVRGR